MNKKNLLTAFMLFSVVLSIGSLLCEQIDKEVASGDAIAIEGTIKWPEWAQKQKEKAALFCKKHKKALKIVAGSLIALGASFGGYHIYNMIFSSTASNPVSNPNIIPVDGSNGSDGGQKGKEKDTSAISSTTSSSSTSSSSEEDSDKDKNEDLKNDNEPKKPENLDDKKNKEEQEKKEQEERERLEQEKRENAAGKERDKEEKKGSTKEKNNKKDRKKEIYETKYTQWAVDRQKELNFSLKQLKVLSQFESNGGSASCGYHALLRSIELVRILNNGYEKEDYTLLTDSGIIDKYFYKKTFLDIPFIAWLNGTKPKSTGRWRQEIINKRTAKKSTNDPDGDWLDDDELRLLWRNYKHLISDKPCECVVIPNFSVIGLTEETDEGSKISYFDHVTNKVNDILAQHAEQKYFSCIFLIGNMGVYQNSEGKDVGSSGHWDALVYNQKKGQRQFYVMNSANNKDLLNDPRVYCLMGMVGQFFYRD